MKNPPTVKTGDKVRVVLEGAVLSTRAERPGSKWGGGSVLIVGGDRTNTVCPDDEHVVSIEVLKPPIKVGDLIETREQLDTLPHGTVVKGPDSYDLPSYKSSSGAWWCAGLSSDVPQYGRFPYLPTRVIFLPE